MHPSVHAQAQPDRIAARMGESGETRTFAALNARSNKIAHLLRRRGLRAGDAVAIMLGNDLRYFDIAWAAQRAGLYYVGVPTGLTADEAGYILGDSGSAILFLDSKLTAIGLALRERLPGVEIIAVDRGGQFPFAELESVIDAMPEHPIADEENGVDMLYSSGTTGRPKGIRVPRPGGPLNQANKITNRGVVLYGMDADTIYLSPAPLYHAAPLRWSMAVQKLGGGVVVMERFDAEGALAMIERFKVTHAQWVPTHLVRMLKLPEAARLRYDHSSLRAVFHSAAPCPVQVKEAMIEWWGPIVHEYYSSTESVASTAIDSPQWLAHRGSVGRAFDGEICIMDDDGHALGPREEGLICMRGAHQFTYHNDPEKTAAAYRADGYATMGDIGWMDEEGFLYLTDRKSFMIISGGVNIYPQEVENLLITHPDVADAAVIGAPDDDLGERVVAIVQPADWRRAGPELAAALAEFLRARISHVKAPRQIDFIEELPRLQTGKLHKRLLADRYREAAR